MPHVKVKVKIKRANICYSTSYSSPEVLYNLRSGSWLAWTNDTAAQYAAVHCPLKWTTRPAVCSKQT